MVRTAWLRRITTYGITAIMACFGLTSVASAQTITNTGANSTNTISSSYTDNCTVTNTNTVSANNYNRQSAATGNATEAGNTSTGLSWSGWSALDPATAQANGQSYTSWWSGIVNWIAQRASGNGWNSSLTNLKWAPSGTSWSGFDPLTWQANGQSFGNWYNAVEAYLNSNSSSWVLTWPANDTGSGSFGTTSGSATNNYNASFSININNAAAASAGVNACGQSNFTPPPPTGGKGGGGSLPGSTTSPMQSSYVPHPSGRSGSGDRGSYYAPRSSSVPAPTVSNPAPVTSTSLGGGKGGGGTTPAAAAPVSTISNTGYCSHNAITSSYTNNRSVTNNNTVAVSSTSAQNASSGNTTSYSNTSVTGDGSGSASNTTGTGYAAGVSN